MQLRRIMLTTLALMVLAVAIPTTASAAIVISEFRLRGPSGANDEFVELYNTSDTAHTVTASSGTGYAVVTSAGATVFTIPNGTVIAPHGYFLGADVGTYSIGLLMGGGAAPDATWTSDIADNAGIALFSSSTTFTGGTRLDAVGSTSEANALYREGAGYPALTPFSINYSFVRKQFSGAPVDTDVNANDFLFVDTNGTSAGAGQRLGAPGPQNSSAPTSMGDTLLVSLLDPSAAATAAPNFVRDLTSNPGANATFGTVSVRRTLTNTGTVPIFRAKLRVTDLETFPAPSGTADLRPTTVSASTTATVNGQSVTVLGSTLDAIPSQPNGGGFNSGITVNGVSFAQPLMPGDSVNVQFLMGIQQTGKVRFCGFLETIGLGGGRAISVNGHTDGGAADTACAVAEINPPVLSVAPVVTGAATQGATLTATAGTWLGSQPQTTTIQWQRCLAGTCTDVAGSTAATYVLGLADVGATLRVATSSANAALTRTATSAQTAAVTDALAPAAVMTKDVTVDKLGRLAPRITCPATEVSCTGYVKVFIKVKQKIVTLGIAKFTAKGGATVTVRVTFSKAALARLKAAHNKLAVSISAVVLDASKNTMTLLQTATVKRT